MSLEPHFSDSTVTLYHGDCLDVLRELPDASVDSVVTDPPYGLEFMGKDWDAPWKSDRRQVWDENFTPAKDATTPFGKVRHGMGGSYGADARAGQLFQAWCTEWAAECLRVLKPGGHMLAFGGTRTFHRLACAVEDAGFEIRDNIAWLYGSGFPKSLDVSKAIDRAAGAEREVVGSKLDLPGYHLSEPGKDNGVLGAGRGLHVDPEARLKASQVTAPATPEAERWAGWGTALKPAFEPIVVARKPLAGTVAANVLAHGTGALNIDGCRIGREEGDRTEYGRGNHLPHANTTASLGKFAEVTPYEPHTGGRWPANVVLDESQAVALDEQSGDGVSRVGKPRGAASGEGWGMTATGAEYADSGGASRFFYTAKADSGERVRLDGTAHPTVKPLALMCWLVRLVTPPGGTVLDPFAGSGTTVEACILEGFRCVAVEREAEYLPLIRQRRDRRRDPVQAVRAAGSDGGLFDLLEGDSDGTH